MRILRLRTTNQHSATIKSKAKAGVLEIISRTPQVKMGKYLEHFESLPIIEQFAIISNNCHHLIYELLNESVSGGVRIPETIYHYTTIESIFHILKGPAGQIPRLRFSACGDLNDPGELKYADALYKQKNLSSDFRFTTAITTEFVSEKASEFGLISFSSKKDDIPLWMSYGNRGAGVALGLNTRRLFNTAGIFCIPAIYTFDDQIRFVKATGKIFGEIVASKYYRLQDSGARQNFNRGVATIMLALKDSRWEYESEWRLVFNNILQVVECQNGVLKKIDYLELTEASSNAPSSYLQDCGFREEDAPYWVVNSGEYLRELVIGPIVQEKQRKLIQFMLEERHLDQVKILLSQCPIV